MEERPVELWIETGTGLLRHHSYHTFLEPHLRQKWTTISSLAFNCIGSCVNKFFFLSRFIFCKYT